MSEMAVPELNKRLLGELEEMGFQLARATRGLHYSGNSSIDDAVNWIFNHENDPDIDQMPLLLVSLVDGYRPLWEEITIISSLLLLLPKKVPVDINIEDYDPSYITEQVKLKAQELRDRAHRKKEEEEKKVEREGENERIKAGKELLNAKRIQEENERKRFIALRKEEKEQEIRDRDKIRQKLQQDKAERRRRIGLPVDNPPPSVKNASTLTQEKKNSLPVKSASLPVFKVTEEELMSDCLRSLKRNHMDDDTKVRRAFQTLLIYVKNVVKNPDEEKFRKIRFSNPAFQDRVGNMKEGIKFLELCGFERVEEGKFLFLAKDKVDMAVLKSAGTVLDSAITNPFFGLLSY